MKQTTLTTWSSTALVAGCVLALAACNEYPLHDLGNTIGEPPSSGSTEPESAPPVAQNVSEIAGLWLGEAEDPFALVSGASLDPPVFRFPSGSTHIWLQIAPNFDGADSGTLTFGDLAPPPPAEDADRGYPVDPDFRVTTGADGSVLPPTEGFPYSLGAGFITREVQTSEQLDAVFAGALVDGKLDLSYLPTQLFESWCPLQTTESCVYTQMSYDDDGRTCTVNEDQTPMDCQKAELCMSEVCTCEPGYPCSYSIQRLSEIQVRLADDGLVGLFSNAVFVNERGFQQPLGTVHFRRVEAQP